MSKRKASKLLLEEPSSKRRMVVRAQPRQRKQKRSSNYNGLPKVGTKRYATSPAQMCVKDYIDTLEDPFEYGPIPLGFGTFLPTTLASGYLRNSFAVNADGSFAIISFPTSTGGVQVNNAGSGVSTWVPNNLTNQSGLNSQFNEARTVSHGLRAIALFPRTSSPGVMFAGCFPDVSISGLTGLTPFVLSALPGSNLGIGSEGAMVTGRPIDEEAYQMRVYPLTPPASTEIPFTTSIYISGLGFPAGTIIWFECILNLEGYAESTSANSIGPPSDQAPPPTPSDFFPSPGMLYSAARKMLKSPVLMEGALTAAEALLPGSGRLLRGVKQLFGGGSHTQKVLFDNAARRSGSSLLIEELESDAERPRTRLHGTSSSSSSFPPAQTPHLASSSSSTSGAAPPRSFFR